MATPREQVQQQMRDTVRTMKAAGLTNQQIGLKLGISESLAHYYSKAQAGEIVCPRCCRPFEKAK